MNLNINAKTSQFLRPAPSAGLTLLDSSPQSHHAAVRCSKGIGTYPSSYLASRSTISQSGNPKVTGGA
jgi:hypothetical protein